ncbi:MAG TPA: periplasmic heavy metal sensor [Candidatus Krumholzibacteria bacterium]|nr:periplasmic heavy metal sensor [Candidatus Krumholzibacteria bacterium]HPD71946.1 periplasmic heavy metal sensor [Candidatus Krumholzibacteria bacterium]HRY41121.1 periplasmic heavy metal sensor [Candidatus Krumholzibacteria bacterium]
MKRGWLIVLLLSLGLNVGLGVNLLRRDAGAPPLPDAPEADDAGAQPDRVRVEGFLRRRLDHLSGELGLSAEQQEALWAVHAEAGERVFERRRAMRAARAELHRIFASTEPAPAQFHAAQRRISALQAELDSMVVEIMVKEREILTPEQRQLYRGLFPEGPDRGRRGHVRERRADPRVPGEAQ